MLTMLIVFVACFALVAPADVASLRRRRDELVWLHDGIERTAPLPR